LWLLGGVVAWLALLILTIARRRRTAMRLDVSRLQGFTGEDTADGAPPALEAECERLVGLGATRLRRDEPAPPTSAGYIVMADPEGNEFCVD
jgi:hypothetical protein